VQSKSVDKITELCLDLIACQKPLDVPFVPRVAIIGPVGSGCFIVASALSKRFNLVNGRCLIVVGKKIINWSVDLPNTRITMLTIKNYNYYMYNIQLLSYTVCGMQWILIKCSIKKLSPVIENSQKKRHSHD